MQNAFLADLQSICCAIMRTLLKIEKSTNPEIITLDEAHEILGYLRSLREKEILLSDSVKLSIDSNEHDSSQAPLESTESNQTKDEDLTLNGGNAKRDMINESMNHDENVAIPSTSDSIDEATETSSSATVHLEIHSLNANNGNNIAEDDSQTTDQQIDAPQLNCHVRNLVVHAIGQLEDDPPSIVIDEPIDQNEPPEIGIQGEVIVSTMQQERDINVTKRSKRKSNLKEDVEGLMKRRRSMDMRIISDSDISSSNDNIVSSKPMDTVELKMKKAMKKRHSASRKTICIPSPIDIEQDDDKEDFLSACRQNTDQQMYANNETYRKWCQLCKKPQSYLVKHYLKVHPDHEVPISRPSPKVAQQLRKKCREFTQNKSDIKGDCMFCEETKCVSKYLWASHLLVHTGEKMFVCLACNETYKTKNEHKKTCSHEPVNIYSMEQSIMGFMCNDCNFLQLRRENVIKHLKNQHGYIGPEEKSHYEKVLLVPDHSIPKQKKLKK